MAENRYAKYASQPSAGVFTLPPSPQQQRTNDRQDANDRRVAELEAERIRLAQQNADFEREKFNRTHNPDGTPKKAPEVAEQPLTAQQLAAVRAEAENKIGLLDSLVDRSKNQMFATGMGTGEGSFMWPFGRDDTGSNAYGTNADVATVSAAGALTKVMEMAKANGGKNPLTPLSEGDFANIAKSISNLDIGQADEQFQKNAGTYRDIYTRALRGAGGGLDQRRLSQLRPADAGAALDQGNASLEQQIAGYTPAEQARARALFQRDRGVQQISGKAPPRQGGQSGKWWDNNRGLAPRRVSMTQEQQAALKKYGL